MRTWRLLAVLVTLLIPGAFSFAQSEPCGNITQPSDSYYSDGSFETIAIEDCNDPFSITPEIASPFTLSIEGVDVVSGVDVIAPIGGTRNYEVRLTGVLTADGASHWFFRHEGNDFVYVDTELSKPKRSDYVRYAREFLPAGEDIDFFVETALSPNDPEFTSDDQRELFYEFLNYVRQSYEPELPVLVAGTYTMVSYQDYYILNHRNPLEKLFDYIIPTAYAQYSIPRIIHTFTFTIREETPEPAGASSVLFLPGIMGSRLYEESGECSLSGSVAVRERWLQVSDCDVRRLETNFQGESTNDIFTFSDARGGIDRAVLPDIYDSFIDAMDEWQTEELINGYRIVPYDWRLSIDAVINTSYDEATRRLVADGVALYRDGYLYRALSELVDTSLSGKVTIVTHSNGGLVAKGLLRKMTDANDPLLQKIDRLIMVAAPQVGTPEALWGLLHGTELGFLGNQDAFLDKETSRLLTNKMAFAHHLLPNDLYFDRVDTAVITFEDGSLTTSWKDEYGQIRDRATLHTFLDDESGRPKPEPDDLLQPEIVDAALLSYARNMETLLDWTPPSSVQVIQVAGTGLDTAAGITYFTDRQCVRHNFGLSFLGCSEYQPKIGYRVNSVIDGDKTVVVPSALYMPSSQAEQWWIDLFSYNDDFLDRKHSNIFEVDELVKFIKDRVLLDQVVSPYIYISDEPVQFTGQPRLTFQLHSPLDLTVLTSNGEISSSTNEVTNAVYRQVGEVQYISVPADTPNIRLVMRGYATGSFTLDIERHEGNNLEERQTFSGVPTATTTVVTATLTSDLPPIELAVDIDGNGSVDARYDEEGIITVPVVTYGSVRTYIKNLSLRPVEKNVLLAALSLAEAQFKNRDRSRLARLLENVALRATERLVESYGKRKLLPVQTTTELTAMIRILIEQTK